MANRLMANRVYTGQKDMKLINAYFTTDAGGVATLNFGRSWGVATVTRNGAAGKYRFQLGLSANGVLLPDIYREFVSMVANVINSVADTAPAALTAVVVNENTATTGLIDVWFYNSAGALVEVASMNVSVQFHFTDSSAP